MARTIDEEKHLELAYRAFDVILDKGVFQTSLTEIARELEMSRTSLYWYFKSIPEILLTVFRDRKQKEEEMLTKHLQNIEDPLELLKISIREIYNFYKETRGYNTLYFQMDYKGVDPSLRELINEDEKEIGELREYVISLLHKGIQKKQLLPHTPEHLMDLVLTFIGGLLLYDDVESGQDMEAVIDLFLMRVLDPLRPPSKSGGK
jgi:AcrR family transcriptional regulator